MTYAQEIELIRTIALSVLDGQGSFVHGRRSDGSLNTIDGAYPQIHLYPTRSTVAPDTRLSTSPILIAFWQQDDVASSPEQRESIIGEMDALARNFMRELYYVASISSYEIEPQYRVHAGTVSGVAVSFTIIAGDTEPC